MMRKGSCTLGENHQNPTPCYLSTALSLQTENTAFQQILSLFILFSLLSSPVSTTNTIRHSRLPVCLPDPLDLTDSLSILFWTSACEQAGSRDFAFVGAVEISSLRLR